MKSAKIVGDERLERHGGGHFSMPYLVVPPKPFGKNRTLVAVGAKPVPVEGVEGPPTQPLLCFDVSLKLWVVTTATGQVLLHQVDQGQWVFFKGQHQHEVGVALDVDPLGWTPLSKPAKEAKEPKALKAAKKSTSPVKAKSPAKAMKSPSPKKSAKTAKTPGTGGSWKTSPAKSAGIASPRTPRSPVQKLIVKPAGITKPNGKSKIMEDALEMGKRVRAALAAKEEAKANAQAAKEAEKERIAAEKEKLRAEAQAAKDAMKQEAAEAKLALAEEKQKEKDAARKVLEEQKAAELEEKLAAKAKLLEEKEAERVAAAEIKEKERLAAAEEKAKAKALELEEKAKAAEERRIAMEKAKEEAAIAKEIARKEREEAAVAAAEEKARQKEEAAAAALVAKMEAMALAAKEKLRFDVPLVEVEKVPLPADTDFDMSGMKGITVEFPELFENKNVVVLGTRAFCPLDSQTMIPSYKSALNKLTKAGVDAVYVLACNDACVMRAWQCQVDKKGEFTFIADPQGLVATALKFKGLKDGALGQQLGGTVLKHFSWLVRNGRVMHSTVAGEDVPEEATFADAMLAALNEDHTLLDRVEPKEPKKVATPKKSIPAKAATPKKEKTPEPVQLKIAKSPMKSPVKGKSPKKSLTKSPMKSPAKSPARTPAKSPKKTPAKSPAKSPGSKSTCRSNTRSPLKSPAKSPAKRKVSAGSAKGSGKAAKVPKGSSKRKASASPVKEKKKGRGPAKPK